MWILINTISSFLQGALAPAIYILGSLASNKISPERENAVNNSQATTSKNEKERSQT